MRGMALKKQMLWEIGMDLAARALMMPPERAYLAGLGVQRYSKDAETG